jgi:2-oxoisovalerate dehydrogenase E1 component
MNAAGVLQVPMVMCVWDDGYGISVSRDNQTIKDNISDALAGFQREEGRPGFEIFKVKGWDYASLITTFEKAVNLSREEHVPVLIHVNEVTQPQGHSTSGSHERYKNESRLAWETEYDCVEKFKNWILEFRYKGDPISNEEELNSIRTEAKKQVRAEQKEAWKEYADSIKVELNEAVVLLTAMRSVSAAGDYITACVTELQSAMDPIRKDIISRVRQVLLKTAGEQSSERDAVIYWNDLQAELNKDRYSSHLYSETALSVLQVKAIAPVIDPNNEVDGRLILRENFDALFQKEPLMVTFGEDTGQIGGVNQSMEGMQAKHGEIRVMDTGIREATIIGQGIGLAMRGMRPLAEIQYLDYLYYALQLMSDDLATVRYRTAGQQKCPLIIRTRGHRLEGIWHSGSPMGAIVNSIRGIMVCVPRNMTQAAGMLNTLMSSDEPALIIEPLNGYRIKEPKVLNSGEFTVALGKVDVTREGTDLTIVSYGSTFNICSQAAVRLQEIGIDVELIDVQTLIPFDLSKEIQKSVHKTNRLMIVDEDVPGGASAYILERVISEQEIFFHLDATPSVLTAKEHRPAYSTDGDYFSKPSLEDIVEMAYGIMNEADPATYPSWR